MGKVPIDLSIMNRNDSNKTVMDWILGIHALLMKGCSEQSEAKTIESSHSSELGQPPGLESTLAWHRCHGDSEKFPLFNPNAARFVRRAYAEIQVDGASVERAPAIANRLP